MRTTRERIGERLREGSATPSALAAEFDIPPSTAADHVRHLARSLAATDEQLFVRPPECEDCGFDGFDDRTTAPSRCPECRSERVAEPGFVVE